MKPQLSLYTRKDCCLCDDMKEAIRAVAAGIPLTLNEIDIDSAPELAERFGSEVPVLFIDDRKAFKYAVSPHDLRKKLLRQGGFRKLARKLFSPS